ncbi:hypothetical protein PBAL39_07910 [Pedobacter sp. BAL39]|uniref:outer membrane beta-barrel protein n=1 Tax=Pedobacter sp. BAL39 TaxID=391596 RepID=UPI0001559785|nr:outer membrane beta-barrel protein [Pedobacter sp. BAL39]EDM34987.1 hypothetical protein PBAL39_07910 [Pedobacter sp. BAL39]
MMKRFLSGLLFLATISMYAHAQKNFQRGYIITNNNDTLKGYVNYKEKGYNSATIDFKHTLADKFRKYTLKECAGWGVEDLAVYRRYVVDVSQATISLSALSDKIDSSSKRDTVFLHVVQDGQNAVLFSYVDANKRRYYALERGKSEPEELTRYVYKRDGRVLTAGNYISKVQQLLWKYNPDAEERRLEGLHYVNADMISVFSKINRTERRRKRNVSTRFFAGPALQVSGVSYTGDDELAGADVKSKSGFGPAFNAGMDLFANGAAGKLFFRAELSVMMSKNELTRHTSSFISNKDIKHNIEQLNIAVTPQALYNIWNKDLLKLYVGVGAALNFTSYPKNERSEYEYQRNRTLTRDVELKSFNVSFPFRAGAVLSKHLELSASYTLPMGITDYAFYTVKVDRYQIGINYLFGKR